MSKEVIGKIYKLKEVEQNKDFKKRKFIIETTGDYPQFNEFEAQNDRVALLDTYGQGDEVKVYYNLRGRLWTDDKGDEKCFNTLVAWKITLITKGRGSNSNNQGEDNGNTEEDMFPPIDENKARGITTAPAAGASDDLPF